jgi:hypothetical protein
MSTRCERDGQVEVGVVEHAGREFRALGASVVGRHVTGYTRLGSGDLALTTWGGQTTLACRSEVVREFRDGSLALVFRLTKGRFVAGYALGENGMLFRGELVLDADHEDARRTALSLADHFAERDAEDDLCWEEAD